MGGSQIFMKVIQLEHLDVNLKLISVILGFYCQHSVISLKKAWFCYHIKLRY